MTAGGGITYKLQTEHVPGKGAFSDTPGLADAELREQAADAISAALKVKGVFKLFFVLAWESRGILPMDKAMMQLVMEACKDVDGEGFRFR